MDFVKKINQKMVKDFQDESEASQTEEKKRRTGKAVERRPRAI